MGGGLEMLRSPRDFAALQERSRSRSHPLLSVRMRRNELGHDRYGIATSRKLGGAVIRNRVRRRIRSILRAAQRPAGAGWDILVVARGASVTASYEDLRSALLKLIASVATKEGTMTE
jgi:ribonuclease P protein component